MRVITALFVFVLTANSAFALLDDGTSSLGCYFDNDGNTICFVPAPATPFNMYFILANPDVENLGGFEFGWRCEPEVVPPFYVLEVTLPPSATNHGDLDNVMVSLDQALPTTPATILLKVNLMTIAQIPPSTCVLIGPSAPTSIPDRATYYEFGHPDDVRPMNFSLWPAGEPQGWYWAAGFRCVGHEWTLPAESRTWSDVKSLFR
jgi:hypothetical protein